MIFLKLIFWVIPVPFLSHEELISEKHLQEIVKLQPDIVWVSLDFPNKKNLFIVYKKYTMNSNFVGIGGF